MTNTESNPLTDLISILEASLQNKLANRRCYLANLAGQIDSLSGSSACTDPNFDTYGHLIKNYMD